MVSYLKVGQMLQNMLMVSAGCNRRLENDRRELDRRKRSSLDVRMLDGTSTFLQVWDLSPRLTSIKQRPKRWLRILKIKSKSS